MEKPRKTAKQLLDMKKQAGFFSVSANSTVGKGHRCGACDGGHQAYWNLFGARLRS